jgi:hypothetical protein
LILHGVVKRKEGDEKSGHNANKALLRGGEGRREDKEEVNGGRRAG